jgi:hypothetical protein
MYTFLTSLTQHNCPVNQSLFPTYVVDTGLKYDRVCLQLHKKTEKYACTDEMTHKSILLDDSFQHLSIWTKVSAIVMKYYLHRKVEIQSSLANVIFPS